MPVGACKECHSAKVRCETTAGATRCQRCTRLNRACIPHISMQGKRRRGTSGGEIGNKDDASTTGNNSVASSSIDEGLKASEDACIIDQVAKVSIHGGDHDTEGGLPIEPGHTHYGLQYLVRSWISIAMRRRSFSLLCRASALAAKVGISMDFLLNEHADRRGMDFLYPILLIPAELQVVAGPRLQWNDLSPPLLRAVNCMDYSNHSSLTSRREERWIWVREMKQGYSRYLATAAFERDITSWALMQHTWKANEDTSVVDLFLAERTHHTKAFVSQLSYHETIGLELKPCRSSHVYLKTNLSSVPIQVEQVICLEIVNLDHAYMFHEYIRQAPPTVVTSTSTTTQHERLLQSVDIPFFNLDQAENDRDLAVFLDLLK